MENQTLKKTIKRVSSSDFQSKNEEIENKKIKLTELTNKDCDNDNIKLKEDLELSFDWINPKLKLENEEISPSKGDFVNNYNDDEEEEITDEDYNNNDSDSESGEDEEENRGIQFVTPQIAAKFLIDGAEDNKYQFIDARYPYEYEGGHIIGSINLYTPLKALKHIFIDSSSSSFANNNDDVGDNFESIDDNLQKMMDKILDDNNKSSSKRLLTTLIFYCEYSSKRAPQIANCVRNLDRLVNFNRYPTLCVPNVWIIEGGYRAFHSLYKDLCSPKGYITMIDGSMNKVYEDVEEKSIIKEGETKNTNLKEEYIKYDSETKEQYKIWSKIYSSKFKLKFQW